MSTNQIMAQELNLQLGDRMPAAISAFARAAQKAGIIEETPGKTLVRSMRDAMAEGKLIAEEILPYVAEELWEVANSGGALEEAMNNTAAAIGRFQTNLWLANKTMNEAGLDRGIRRMVNATSDAINRSDGFWRFMGQALQLFTNAIRGPMELLAALGEKLSIVEDYAGKLGLQLTDLVAILMLFHRWTRRILIIFMLLPAAMSGLGKILDGESLSWMEWAVTLAGVAIGLGTIYKLLKNIKGLRGKLGGDHSAVKSPSARTQPQASTRSPETTNPTKRKFSIPKIGKPGKIAIGIAAFESLRELLSGGEIIGGDGWSVRAPNFSEMIERQRQLEPLLGPHGGVQPGQLPFGEVRVERIDIHVEGNQDPRETAEQTYLIFRDEVRRAAMADQIQEQ
jgi:hypothetical protein